MFASFLSNRRHRTYCNSTLSDYAICNTGVPQGSICSPLLFILFINDLFFVDLDSSIFSYADDTTLIQTNNSMDDAIVNVNRDLAKVSQWFHHNWLELNFDKTNCILFSPYQSNLTFPVNSIYFGNTVINENLNTTLLGVRVSKTLTWEDQIDKICISLGFVNSMLFRLKMQSLPARLLLIVYKTLFLPYINYACSIWGLTTRGNLDRLEKFQNSALRIIYGFSRREHVTPYRKKHSLLNVRQIVYRSTCNFIHKELKRGSFDSYFQPYFYYSSFSSRNHNKLYLPYARLLCRQRTLFFRGIQMYNNLPSSFREETVGNFKKLLKKHSFTLDDIVI